MIVVHQVGYRALFQLSRRGGAVGLGCGLVAVGAGSASRAAGVVSVMAAQMVAWWGLCGRLEFLASVACY
jgi:hypothetical protein